MAFEKGLFSTKQTLGERNMEHIIQKMFLKKYKPVHTPPKAGDKVNVHIRIFEGGKERIQVFQGMVLKVSGSGISRSFTVRKISDGVGVEKTFPLSSPTLARLEVLSQSKVRRARLYYMRKLKGRAAKLSALISSQQTSPQQERSSSPESKS